MKIFMIMPEGVPLAGGCTAAEEADGGIVWYEIPDSAILRSGGPFFIPDFAADFRAYTATAYRIGRLGKGIARRFASRYIDASSAAAVVVAVDLLERCRRCGLPWAPAVAFDKCCWLGNFMPVEALMLSEAKRIAVEKAVEILSRDITLKTGDLILIGEAREAMRLQAPSPFEIYDDNNKTKLLDIHIR